MVFLGICNLIVAFSVGIIAYRQYKTACEKLRFDLFEKRFAIWVSLRSLTDEIGRNSNISAEVIHKFRSETREARWFFSREMVDYLELVAKQAEKLRSNWIQIDHLNYDRTIGKVNSEKDIERLFEKNKNIAEWFLGESNDVSLFIFSNYLDFTKQ